MNGLGLERQRILTDAMNCDVRSRKQVDALFDRIHRYLYEDNIRTHLKGAIDGLGRCREPIQKKAQRLPWRKRDKQTAVDTFIRTLDELESLLVSLVSNFYPGGSGMGAATLGPIYDLLKKVRDTPMGGHKPTYEVLNKKLRKKIATALQDESHEKWIEYSGKVEALIVDLQLAFSLKET